MYVNSSVHLYHTKRCGLHVCKQHSTPVPHMIMIRSSILMNTVFYKELILQREIWPWSLLGLTCKGLRNALRSVWRICMRILVLKGLKQAIEAHTARAYLGLSSVNCPELFPAQLPLPLPGWVTSPPQHCSQWYVASLKKIDKIKDLWEER